MGVLKGIVSITDNGTAVLKKIKAEQSSFRNDAVKTRKELQATWDKKRTAKLETTAAAKKMDELKKKLKPLRDKVVTAVAIKDMATAKIKSVSNKVKAVSKMAAKPIVAIKDATAAGLSKIKNDLKSLTKTVVVPVAVAATAAIGASVSQGAKLEQSIGGIETLFKDNSGIVKENANRAFQTAGLSANNYMETVTSFSASLIGSLAGDTTKAAQVANMAIVDMADNANKFGTDMESIQNAYQGFAKQNYTMLDNLKLGYGGTKEEMSRLLKDASALTGMRYDVDNLSDIYNAVHAIQENLGVAGTTAKEASETFSGAFAAMKASASNLLGNLAIGGDITASMEQLVDSAATFLFQNAVPMIGGIIKALPSAIKTGIAKAAPMIKEAGGAVIQNLKDGMVKMLPPSMRGVISSFAGSFRNFGKAFSEMKPQLAVFGSSVSAAVQKVATATLPVITAIITMVQQVIPAVLPVLQTVITTISSLLARVAPIISGLVTGIATVVSTLSPVFSLIFGEIGEKVGTVIDFISSKMDFIQDVISAVAPIISDVLTTAWDVISPVMDLLMNVFEAIFSVVERVFPGIQKILGTVWDIVKPIIEGIGWVVGKIANAFGWIADKLTGGSSEPTMVGENAQGTNNWRGGLTWVGERGPELVDLPRGSKIIPNKESVGIAAASAAPVIQQAMLPHTAVSGTPENTIPLLSSIDRGLAHIAELIVQLAKAKGQGIAVTIAKLADTIVIREEADIERIGKQIAKELQLATANS